MSLIWGSDRNDESRNAITNSVRRVSPPRVTTGDSPLSDLPRRHSRHDRQRRDVLRHDRTGSYHRAVPYGHAVHHTRAGTEPDVVPDPHRTATVD